ncbi:hypothetical protein GCM10023205_68370 [Yinghuangia aomiensis]|uniref:Uncharacterized protein n=1 Tax=Yinghuangia aomiensis TaxID=676205 RepID=A0ABP9I5I9_9ACTN
MAVLLDTPYGFQENVADISARAQAYFARSVGVRADVALGLRAPMRRPGWSGSRPPTGCFRGPGARRTRCRCGVRVIWVRRCGAAWERPDPA